MSGNRACPEDFELREGPRAAHLLLEARIDALTAERDAALARAARRAPLPTGDLRTDAARALAGMLFCDDPECEPCSLDPGRCPASLDTADDFAEVLDAMGLEIRRQVGAS